MITYFFSLAVVDDDVAPDVLVTVDEGGSIARVDVGATPAADSIRLAGVALPGLVSAHSHAFHRALRGRTHDGGGTFWTWRALMYRVASRLTPTSYYSLARGVFAEMLTSGYTTVGEFHYVHGDGSGDMERAVIAAASDVGIRLTLLDTLYLGGGLSPSGAALPLSPEQRQFSDGSVEGWISRHGALPTATTVYQPGMAAHSLRAVSPGDAAAQRRAFPSQVFHAHVSEQPGENAQVLAAFGATPVRLLADAGVLDERFTGVHLTHLTSPDVDDLAAAGALACFCPTTERDLADGIGQARVLSDAGVRLALGSDQNAVVDPFEEIRALEMHERLVSGSRGRFTPSELLTAATVDGYASLGWKGGRISPGHVADFVVVDPASPRTAGSSPSQLWLTATAADVTDVVVAGRQVVRDRAHPLGDVGAHLAETIATLLDREPSS